MLELLLSYERREFLQFLSSSTVKSYLHLLEGKCEKFHFNIRLRILFTHNWAQLRTKSLIPKHRIRYLYTTKSNFQTKILPIWYKYSHKLLLNTNALNRKVNRESSARGKSEISLWIRSQKKEKKRENILPSCQGRKHNPEVRVEDSIALEGIRYYNTSGLLSFHGTELSTLRPGRR